MTPRRTTSKKPAARKAGERFFRIGGLLFRLRLEGIPAAPLRGFFQYLAPFAAEEGEPDATFRFRRVRTGPAPAPGEDLARAVWEPLHRFPFEERAQDLFRLRLGHLRPFLASPEFREACGRAAEGGWADAFAVPLRRLATICFPSQGLAEVFLDERETRAPSPLAMSLFFQVLSAILASRDGLLVHGSGIVRDGAAYAFVGLSGAGKSTVGRLSEGALLADDGLVLRRDAEGFRAFATPFCQQREGKAWKAGVKAGSAPLAGLFFLEKAKEHRVEPVPGPEAALKILQHYVHYYRSFPASAAAQAFRTVESLVRSCPVRTLRFRKDAEFWDVIPARACLPAQGEDGAERKGREGTRRGAKP